ncbi:MAG TPA: type I methionyl aminopeptidase [Chloroflexota bacterium]|nr:type I methionyl aminopeptidase [Chloroflexota bacterium]
MAIILKTPSEMATMREAGRIVANTLTLMHDWIKPGVTTAELDGKADAFIRKHNAKPSFKGYNGFPASICVAVNDQVVHGIPGGQRLEEGDIITIDIGANYRGLHGDAAVSYPVGKISSEAQRLLDVCQEALKIGIAQARSGRRLSDIGAAIQPYVEGEGFSVVRQYCGHGVGRHLHEDPQVFHYGPADRGPVLRRGMVLTIEPMINAGKPETRVLDDKWTVITGDGSLSAQFEHTVAITDDGPRLLTLP